MPSPPGQRPAVLVSGEPTPGRLIAWEDIEKVEAKSSNAGSGFLWGAGVGLAAATVTVVMFGTDIAETGDNGILTVGAAFTFSTAMVGWAIGAMIPHHTKLYP